MAVGWRSWQVLWTARAISPGRYGREKTLFTGGFGEVVILLTTPQALRTGGGFGGDTMERMLQVLTRGARVDTSQGGEGGGR